MADETNSADPVADALKQAALTPAQRHAATILSVVMFALLAMVMVIQVAC